MRAQVPDHHADRPTVASSATYNLYTAQLSLSYAPDVFGATRRSVEARARPAGGDALPARGHLSDLEQQRRGRPPSRRPRCAGRSPQPNGCSRLQHELTETVRRQRAIGTASELDVLAQQSAEAQTAQTLPPLQKQLGQTRDALTALLGRLPSEEPGRPSGWRN